MRLNNKYVVCLFIMILPLAFDFKKDYSGLSLVQLLMVLGVFFGFFFFLIEGCSSAIKMYKGQFILCVFLMVYCLLGIVIGVMNGANIYSCLNVALPYLLMSMIFFSCCMALNAGITVAEMFKVLLLASLLSLVWRLVLYAFVRGGDLSEARYFILTPAMPLLMSVYLYKLFYIGSRKVVDILAFLIIIFIAVTSQTRGILLVFAAGFVLVYVMYSKEKGRAGFRRALSTLLISGLFLGLGLVLVYSFNEGIIVSFWERLYNVRSNDSGVDYTAVTRYAEYIGQLNKVHENFLNVFFGLGFGSLYEWDQSLMALLPEFELSRYYSNSGHSTWVYSIFSHGYILGLCFNLVFFRLVFYSVSKLLLKVKHSNYYDLRRFNEIDACIFGFVGFMAWSLTSGIMGERFSGAILGVLMAIIMYGDRHKIPSSKL